MRQRLLLFLLLPLSVISFLLSFTLYGLQGYPLKNLLFATVVNQAIYLLYGYVMFALLLPLKNLKIRALAFTLFTNIPVLLSVSSIGSKLAWGQFVTFSILIDILSHYQDFIEFSPFPPYLILSIWLALNFILFQYYLIITRRCKDRFFNKKQLIILTSAICISLGACFLSNRFKVTMKNHIVFNDHFTCILINSINGGITFANNKSDFHNIKATNIDDYHLKYESDLIKAPNSKNIVLIVVDALRADKIGAQVNEIPLTPFLDSMISSSQIVSLDNTFSTCGNSACGILSLLASKQWDDLGLFNYLLQDHLKRVGYKNHFFLSGLHSSWYNIGKQYMSNVDVYYEGKDSELVPIGDDQLIIEGLDRYLPQIEKQNFFYLHLMSTHFFGKIKPKYQSFLPINTSLVSKKEARLQAYINNYNNGVIQADDIIKETFRKLNQFGILDNCIVIITADHGEALGENDLIGHSASLTQKEIQIPFLVFGVEPQKIARDNSTHNALVDIAPTIIDLVEIPMPKSWQGTSILEHIDNNISYHVESDFKAVVYSNMGQIFKKQYDLRNDKVSFFDLSLGEKEVNPSDLPQSIFKVLDTIQL